MVNYLYPASLLRACDEANMRLRRKCLRKCSRKCSRKVKLRLRKCSREGKLLFLCQRTGKSSDLINQLQVGLAQNFAIQAFISLADKDHVVKLNSRFLYQLVEIKPWDRRRHIFGKVRILCLSGSCVEIRAKNRRLLCLLLHHSTPFLA